MIAHPKIIGITGSIGSGKSTAAKIFRQKGFPTLDADHIAKDLIQSNFDIRHRLLEAFGPAVFDSTGHLNREYLSQVVFTQPKKLQWLNAIVHPFVIEEMIKRSFLHQSPVVWDVPLLIESGLFLFCDWILLLTVSPAIRQQRLKNSGIKNWQKRLSFQFSDRLKSRFADFIIKNDSSIDALKKQIGQIIETIGLEVQRSADEPKRN